MRIRLIRVVLPAPEWPTRAIVSLLSSFKSISVRTGEPSSYWKETLLNSIVGW